VRRAWLVTGLAAPELELHLAWDLLPLPPPQLRVLPVRTTAVVLPYSRDPEREVYLNRCQEEGVPVVRRPSGGGAVVLAPGVVTLSALAPLEHTRSAERLFARFCGWLAEALASCGVQGLVLRGVSDLCLGERKVAGTALRLTRASALFQASVLVECDSTLFERYLPYPSRAPDYRKGRSHKEFVTTLREAGYTVSCEEVAAALAASFRRVLAASQGLGPGSQADRGGSVLKGLS